jgi:L-fuconolactonase
MPSRTIDIHPHIIADDAKRYPPAPLGGHQSDWSRTRPVTIGQMIAAMDAAGVDKAALVQASTCYGHDNSYVADAVAADPRRFTGVFSVDVLAPDAPDKMRYWRGKGLTGMRLFTIGSTMSTQADWIDDPKAFPAWEAAGELCLPICMQTSANSAPRAWPGAPTTRPRRGRSRACWRSRAPRSPRRRRPTRSGFSPRPRRPSIRRWRISTA